MSWPFFHNKQSRKSPSRRWRAFGHGSYGRLSRFESLEKRHLLATYTVSSLADAGANSLREAISDANNLAGPDIITFANSVNNMSIGLLSAIEIKDSLTIQGPGASLLTIDAQSNSRIFNITAAADDVTIQGLTMTGGDSGTLENGGAILCNASGLLSISNSVITANVADRYGGGIYAYGDVLLSETTISDNDAQNGSGGGLFAFGYVNIQNGSRFTNNTATIYGGGIYGIGEVNIEDSIIGGTGANQANKALSGGGVYSDGTVSVTRSEIVGNTAMTAVDNTFAAGGGINAGTVSVIESTVSNNSVLVTGNSYSYGGGIYAGTVSVIESEVSNNSALAAGSGGIAFGGGIYANGNVMAADTTVSANTALDGGGGIYASGAVTLESSTVGGSAASAANRAVKGSGGGIYARSVTAKNSSVSNNFAGRYGGGIYSYATATIRNSTIARNNANVDGGGISGFNVTLQNATVASNRARVGGVSGEGGGVSASNRLAMRNSIVVGNFDNVIDPANPDVFSPANGTNVRYSLIGDKRGTNFTATGSTTPDAATGNLIGDATDATKHILLSDVLESSMEVAVLKNNNSPQAATTDTIKLIGVAIDKGSNSLVVSSDTSDQRGLPFARIFGTQVDMGAFEVQTESPEINVKALGSNVASGGTVTIPGTITGSVTIPITIFNVGTAALNLTGTPKVAVTSGSADFAVVAQPTSPVQATNNVTFDVKFTPTISGTRTGTLTIASNDSDEGTYTINLQGTGNVVGVGTPEINVQVNNVTVPSGGTAANVGSTNGAITVPIKIQNTGTGVLSLTGSPLLVTVTGANASDFVVTQPGSGPIAANGGELTFNVSFMPAGDGPRTATLTIANNDADEGSYTIVLQGTGAGVVAGSPEINLRVNGIDVLSGGTFDFGPTNSTLSRTVTIDNFGSGALNLTGVPFLVSVSGTNAGEFVVTQPAANTVAAGNNISFSVAFTPSGIGVRTATLTIPNNDGNENPYTITLQGNNGSVSSSKLFSEDFNDGTVDTRIVPQTGVFGVTGTAPDQAYVGVRQSPGQNAIATINLLLPLPTHFKVEATVTPIGGDGNVVWSNGFIIFDYVSPTEFKFAGVHEFIDRLVIGQISGGKKTTLKEVARSTNPNVDVGLSLDISGSTATLTSGGQVLTYNFGSALYNRPVGIGALNAASTFFDDITVTQLS